MADEERMDRARMMEEMLRDHYEEKSEKEPLLSEVEEKESKEPPLLSLQPHSVTTFFYD